MLLDVNTFLGPYPWRDLPGTDLSSLLLAMDRTGIDEAWVSHLPSLFWRDPAPGTAWLLETCAAEPRFHPVPSIHPGLPGWRDAIETAREAGAPAVRCDPQFRGLDPAGAEMRAVRPGVEVRVAGLGSHGNPESV